MRAMNVEKDIYSTGEAYLKNCLAAIEDIRSGVTEEYACRRHKIDHNDFREIIEYSKKVFIVDNPEKYVTIEEAGFSGRTYNCLANSQFKTLGEVAELRIIDMRQMRNVGKGTIEEICEILQQHNLIPRADYEDLSDVLVEGHFTKNAPGHYFK